MTRQPELTFLPSQTAVVEFGIATNRKWNDRDGNKKEEVCFVTCKCFGKQAETMNKYVSKGDPLLIEGRLSLDQWEANGMKHSKHWVFIESFQFIGKGEAKQTEPKPEPRANDGPTDEIPF